LGNYEYKTLESAKEDIESSGLTVVVKYEENPTVSKGTVIRQEPKESTTVKVGSTVTLVVSNGYTVTVPDVRGKTLQKAQDVFPLVAASVILLALQTPKMHSLQKHRSRISRITVR
jgi:beta-lactam-binding protein with PASTA domain